MAGWTQWPSIGPQPWTNPDKYSWLVIPKSLESQCDSFHERREGSPIKYLTFHDLHPSPATNWHTFLDPSSSGAWHTLWTAPNCLVPSDDWNKTKNNWILYRPYWLLPFFMWKNWGSTSVNLSWFALLTVLRLLTVQTGSRCREAITPMVPILGSETGSDSIDCLSLSHLRFREVSVHSCCTGWKLKFVISVKSQVEFITKVNLMS